MDNRCAILCVDDEEMVLVALRQQIEDAIGENCIVEVATSGEDALELMKELIIEDEVSLVLIVSDWLMPGMKGDEFLIKTHSICPNTVKIILSGQADTEAIQRVKEQVGLKEFISKPWDTDHLIGSIKSSLAQFECWNTTK